MMSDIRISVVMPAYNAEKFIGAAIESVLCQTFSDFEFIIVDDCATDGTANVILDYAAKDDRICYYKNPRNSGVAMTRNFGVNVAKGDWIAFIDSDDLWREDKLQKQMEIIETGEADVIYTSYSFIDPDNTPYQAVFHVPTTLVLKEYLKQNVVSCSGIVLRKALLETHTMKHDDVHEDFFTWLTIIRDGAIAVGIDEPLHTVRVARKESKSGNKLKSAKMTFQTYRLLGVPFVKSVYYFVFYTIRNLKKYSKL